MLSILKPGPWRSYPEDKARAIARAGGRLPKARHASTHEMIIRAAVLATNEGRPVFLVATCEGWRLVREAPGYQGCVEVTADGFRHWDPDFGDPE